MPSCLSDYKYLMLYPNKLRDLEISQSPEQIQGSSPYQLYSAWPSPFGLGGSHNQHAGQSNLPYKFQNEQGFQSNQTKKPHIGLDQKCQSHVELFKKLPQADELLQILPMKFRKKMGQVIEAYESERFGLELKIKGLFKQLEHKNIQRSGGQQIIQDSTCENTSNKPSSLQDRLQSGHQQGDASVIASNRQLQTIRMTNMILFTREGFEHQKNCLAMQLDRLRSQVEVRDSQAVKVPQGIQQLNRKIAEQSQELELLRRSTQYQKVLIKDLEEACISLETMNKEIKKSMKHKKQSPQERRRAESPEEENRRSFPVLKVNTVRKLSNQHNRSPSQRSPRSATRSRRVSLRETLSNSRSKDVSATQQQEQDMGTSQCDSIQFGKQKVVQKRKVRKIFSNLLSATSKPEKKDVLQKLAIEIGLKSKDFEPLLNVF